MHALIRFTEDDEAVQVLAVSEDLTVLRREAERVWDEEREYAGRPDAEINDFELSYGDLVMNGLDYQWRITKVGS